MKSGKRPGPVRKRELAASLLAGAAFATLVVAIPGWSQESILPPGFEQPTEPEERQPTPDPTPSPTPSRPAPQQPVPGVSQPSSPRTAPRAEDESELSEEEREELEQARRRVSVDLPSFARRSLDRFGPMTVADGGMPANAFGNAGGRYLSTLMRETRAPIASRWATILLRRALLSEVETPATIGGADWAAARASLLLRMGDANGARTIVQSIDNDRFSPRLLSVALGTFAANADPAGLCPIAELGNERSDDPKWLAARAMCAAMRGDASEAGRSIDRLRNRQGGGALDVLLAQRIVGAGINSRRSVTLEWDDVDSLDSWNLGLATASGIDLPDRLLSGIGARANAWRATAPMTRIEDRLRSAQPAASIGILSSRSYGDLVASLARAEDADDAIADLAGTLRNAYAAADQAERLAAMRSIWGDEGTVGNRYGNYVLTARAAARMDPTGEYDIADIDGLITAMLAGGYDLEAIGWLDEVERGTKAWAMIVTANPAEESSVSSGAIENYFDRDASAGKHSTSLLVASLAGLGRIDEGALEDWGEELDIDYGRESRFSRAIAAAAARREPGTVAVLAGVGMQGRGWENVSPVLLYTIISALRRVGLDAEARMIGAEAVARS